VADKAPIDGFPFVVTYTTEGEPTAVTLYDTAGDGSGSGGSGSGPGSGSGGIMLFHDGVLDRLTPSITAPVAAFSYALLANKIVAFSNKSLNNPTLFLWTFGDGQTSSAASPYHQYAADGTYSVTLTVQNAGGTSTKTVSVTISTVTAKADFTYVAGGLGVLFTDASTVSGNRSWTFGDGGTSTETNPYHLFASAGTYTVTLTIGGYTKTVQVAVENAAGIGDFVAKSSYGFSGTTRGIALYGDLLYVTDNYNQIVVLNKNTLAYVTVFGIGTFVDKIAVDANYVYATSNTSVKVYAKADYSLFRTIGSAGTGDGQFTYAADVAVDDNYVYVTDRKGTVTQLARVQIFNKSTGAFVAKFGTYGDSDGQIHGIDSVEVDASSFYVGDAYWGKLQRFNKNSPYAFVEKISQTTHAHGLFVRSAYLYDISVGENIIRKYDTATNAVLATISKASGSGDGQLNNAVDLTSDGSFIYVADTFNNRVQKFSEVAMPSLSDKPATSFSADVTYGDAPLTVQFTDHSTNTPTAWAWEFGDGTTSTSQSPSHEFTAAGMYTVRLTASNATGAGEPYSMTIIVTDVEVTLPVISTSDFTSSAQLVEQGDTLTFTDTSTGDVTTWLWNFGDGQTSASQSPTHSYTNPGIYEVTLTTTDTTGMTTVSSQTIVVYATGGDPDAADNPPTAVVSASATAGTAPMNVAFTVVPSVETALYAWNFGDGQTSTAQNPTHLFTAAGTYTVTLTISNIYGSTTTSMTIVVSGQVAAAFGPAYTYIVDRTNHRVLVYDSAGNAIGWFGGLGSSPGKLNLPSKLVVNRARIT
jgi:PKD repeat protein